MTHQIPCQETSFGYLSTLESPEHGFLGGYLLISPQGRPLEFHCTAAVRPSRAQEILYGPTLRGYVLGEQIGGSLLATAALFPQLIITDQLCSLCLRPQLSVPLIQLATVDHGEPDSALHSECVAPPRFQLAGHHWELPEGYESDWAAVAELLTQLSTHVDLPEPFGRIHEAIREAQRIGERGTDAQIQAA